MVLIPQGTGRVGRRRGFILIRLALLTRSRLWVLLLLGGGVIPLKAQDLPLFVNQGMKASFEQQFFYNHEKHDLDFDTRGRFESQHQAAGGSLSYTLTDTIQLALAGGALINPELKNSVLTYRGETGYFYDFEVADHVFPPTESWPGILIQAGVGSQTSFFDRRDSGGTQMLISQKMTDLRYGGAVVASWKFKSVTPYFGPRLESSNVRWSDNQPSSGNPAHIEGHLDKKIGIVLGCTFTIVQGLDVQLEGRALGETSLRASIQWLKF
jgi:hypothetical protein